MLLHLKQSLTTVDKIGWRRFAAGMVFVCGLALVSPVFASEVTGSVELELRNFDTSQVQSKTQNAYFSAAADVEYYRAWRDGADSFSFKGFARYDEQDSRRTHTDIRELLWTHVGDSYETRIGINKVFWGVAESQHLVDVINQTDLVERIDGEEKLGQPMVNVSVVPEWGTLDVFILPYFRERTFSGENGRFYIAEGLPVVTDNIEVTYESSRQEKHVDAAVRWASSVGPADVAVSYFQGTNREPLLTLSSDGSQINAFYSQIKQLSLEYQQNYKDAIFKFEGYHRRDSRQDYFAAVAGIEYTLYGILGTSSDLGLLAELNHDERSIAETVFQNDTFYGLRYALNDTESTTVLGGVLVDNDFGTRFWSLEASRRFRDRLKVFIEARVVSNAGPRDQIFYQFRNDDYIEVRIEWFL